MTTPVIEVHDYYRKKKRKLFLQKEVKRILVCCDWQPKQARWAYLACLGFPAWVPKVKTIIMISSF